MSEDRTSESDSRRTDPQRILLDVPQILQNPELPNGCEITSCCELLRFWGFAADKCDLADHYLKRSEKWFGADPDLVYMGDPHLEDESEACGFYCFAGPIVDAANRYIRENSLPEENRNLKKEKTSLLKQKLTAVDITGSTLEELEALLRKGVPFMFWASLRFEDIGFDSRGGYELPGGGYHRLFHGLHCMACRGMDKDTFYIADPLNLNERVPKTQFMKIFLQLGQRAVTILPVPGREGPPVT